MWRNSSNAKNIIIISVFVLLIAANIYSYMSGFGEQPPMYHPHISNQTMYMPEYLKDGMRPDALLRAIVKKKKVAYWSDFHPYTEYPSHGHDHSDDPNVDVFFSYSYYSDNNYGLFFKKYAGGAEIDDTLPEPGLVTKVMDEKKRDKYFTYIGFTSDMLRNSFLVNEDREYVNSYFHYSYFYYDLDDETMDRNYHAYLAPKDIAEADDLVAIWDSYENLYLMSRDYYEENIKGLF